MDRYNIPDGSLSLKGNIPTRREVLSWTAGTALALAFPKPGFSAQKDVYPASAVSDATGVATHTELKHTVYGRFEDVILPGLIDLGVKHIRTGIPVWPYVNAKRLEYVLGRIMVDKGIKLCCVTTDEDYQGGGATDVSRLPAAFEWFDRGIEYIEGPNEPNYFKDPQWAKVAADAQRRLYSAVRGDAEMAAVKVLGPSFWGPTGAPAGDLTDCMDYGNIHPYSGGRHPEVDGKGSLAFYVEGARANCGDKPLVASETGYHSAMETKKGHPPVSEEMIARYLPRLLLFNLANGIVRSYIYELADSHDRGMEDQESHFGLIRPDGTRKAAFQAVANLLGFFRDAEVTRPRPLTYSVDTQHGPPLYKMLFQFANGEYALALWLGVSGWDADAKTALPIVKAPANVKFPNPVHVISEGRFDTDGSLPTRPIGARSTNYALEVSDAITLLKFRPV